MSKDIIDQLNTYRLENKLSQTELARQLDVTFQTINRWLNRHMRPSQIQAFHIQKLIQGKQNQAKGFVGPKGKA